MSNSYLAHYGTKGQKWGNRRYQNKDGSLTPEGKARYSKQSGNRRFNKEHAKEMAKKIGRAAVNGAAGGVAAGGVTLALAVAAPGALPSTAVFAFGKTVATRIATEVGVTAANEIVNSFEVKNGKRKADSMLKSR